MLGYSKYEDLIMFVFWTCYFSLELLDVKCYFLSIEDLVAIY